MTYAQKGTMRWISIGIRSQYVQTDLSARTCTTYKNEAPSMIQDPPSYSYYSNNRKYSGMVPLRDLGTHQLE